MDTTIIFTITVQRVMNSILLNPLHIAGNVHFKTERESMLGRSGLYFKNELID